MTDQVAVLESIRDVLSGKATPAPAVEETNSEAQDDDIMNLTLLVNDDGSITDLESEVITNDNNANEEIESMDTTNTAGDDVLDEIDRLLADDSPAEVATPTELDELLEPLESITDDSVQLELAEETKILPAEEVAELEEIAEEVAEIEPSIEPNNIEENMTDNNNVDTLIADDQAEKAKSAISDLLKVTGKDKAEPAPSHQSPSFRNGDTVEDLVLESLKPMLKKWLDENLGSLVEEIVQKEISRIIPK